MTVHVMLDIDGVLSPEGALADSTRLDLSHVNDWANWQTSEELMAFFMKLLEKTTVRWCSLWEHDSNFFSEALGLPALPYMVFWNNTGVGGEWLKFKAVSEFLLTLPESDLVIWLDDELDEDSRERITAFHPRVVTFKPNPSIGLSAEEQASILELISQESV